jgi:hypothetical protein
VRLLPILILCLCGGCAFNRPHYTECPTLTETTYTNGVTIVRQWSFPKELTVPTWALWPATTSLEKQRVTIGKTMAVGTSGLQEESTSTNAVVLLESIMRGAMKGLMEGAKIP